jgi:hypothetical protein
MKKRNPSNGKKGQLVHCWPLVHSGHIIPTLYDCLDCVSTALYYKAYSALQL